MPIPCTKYTHNNPGCRCVACLKFRRTLKAVTRAGKTVEARKRQQIAQVRTRESRKRARPWEGVGRHD